LNFNSEATVRIQQTSEEISETQWKWSLWLEGSDEELQSVQEVVYHLHPTFTQSVVTRSNRESKFRIDANGWGTFVVKIEVLKTDGTTEQILHRLRFSRSEPQIFISGSASDEPAIKAVKQVAQNLQMGAICSQDVPVSEDLESTIREQIDRSNAFILINGSTPSRWVMAEVQMARALGKPIVSIGENVFYDTSDSQQIDSIDELQDVIDKLRE
jgi:hypothetical protein